MMTVVGFCAAVFPKFGLPKTIGFILAGILMGAHTWSGAWLVDEASVRTIGQLGIVFLMFALGLEFSIGSMRRVGHVAVPVAIADVALMTWFGFLAGTKLFGWGWMQSLFLGAAICDSATTLLSKTIEEMNWSGRPFTRYIFGITIMEDILCVGVLAALTGLAAGEASAAEMFSSMGRLALFLVGAVVIGATRMARFLDSARKYGRESVLLASLGFCFLVTWVADRLEIGMALGAFVAGVICSTSRARDEIHAMAEPLRSMFAAVFFVAVGLLVNPQVCLDHAGTIAAVTALVVFGKFANVTVASLLSGQSLKNSVQTGMGLAQIGEFAYMVAMIYVALSGRADDPMYQIVVAASIITTMLNPFFLKFSDAAGDWAERRQPRAFRKMMAGYSGWLERFRSAKPPSRQKLFLRVYIAGILVSWVLMFIVFATCGHLAKFDYTRFGAWVESNKRLLLCFAANLGALLPSISVAVASRKLGRIAGSLVASTWAAKGAWRRASQPVVRTFVHGLCLFSTLALVLVLNLSSMPEEIWARVLVFGTIGAYGALKWNSLRAHGGKAARRLRAALAAEKRIAAKNAALMETPAPGDASPAGVRQRKFTVPAGSPFEGETIGSADIRRRTGATVICLERAGEPHWNPGPGWRIEAGDILSVIADESHFRQLVAIASSGAG